MCYAEYDTLYDRGISYLYTLKRCGTTLEHSGTLWPNPERCGTRIWNYLSERHGTELETTWNAIWNSPERCRTIRKAFGPNLELPGTLWSKLGTTWNAMKQPGTLWNDRDHWTNEPRCYEHSVV